MSLALDKGWFIELVCARRTRVADLCPLSYSGFTPTSRPDLFSLHARDLTETHSRERQPKMAAAALMSPASAYHPHNPAFPPSYSHPSPAPMPGMLSQGGSSRRTSKDSESAQRTSLPSISEMINTRPNAYSPTTPKTVAGPSNLPPPPPPASYNNSAPSRIEPGHESRPPPPPFSQRPETGGPGPAYLYSDQRELARQPESLHRNGSLSGSHAPPVPYPAPGQLPPGQLPLTQGPPISPRHLGPPMPPPYDPQRPPPMHGDEEYGVQRRYDPNALNRHFEVWGYTDCLQRVITPLNFFFPIFFFRRGLHC